ncbi:DUF881 domain-containing protein [Cellulomonas iranensis]|uniref:DUF881 domain-containing protein n=1 Tax=Cellulomonas iranensis TaxID=76862 RepID=UPI0023F409F9|nr:DUF881 domain-containing protein [Cellulomonas iranensis]
MTHDAHSDAQDTARTIAAPPRARIAGMRRGAVAVGLVLGLSGLLFTVNARAADAGDGRHPQNLAELTQQQAANVERLSVEVDTLRAQVQSLTAEQDALAGRPGAQPLPAQLVEGGSAPVTGRGLVIQLDDAPADTRRDDVRADLLVVHQEDIQTVMNALWAGGAEAMGLMDQRVVATTGVQCQGNVLRLHGRMYSPPFVVTAVGDPDRLRAALEDDPAVRTYVRQSGELGLGWHVESKDRLELPAYSGATELNWAQVPDDVDVLPGDDTTPPATARAARTPEDGVR